MVRFSNLELLELLEKNSRRSFTDIARKFGVSETAIRKRITQLLETEMIDGFTLKVNPRRVNFSIGIIGVDTLPEVYFRILEELKKDSRIKTLFTSSGDHMILLECWVKDNEEMREFVSNLESLKGVVKVCPAVLLDRIK